MTGAREPVVVAGAGLVGSLLAIFLARRGHRVELIERRPDMRKGGAERGRSINLAVSRRGIHALAQVGMDARVLKSAIPMRGRMMHARDGKLTFQPYGTSESHCIHSISRSGLNMELLDEAERLGVGLRFGKRVESVDFRGNEIALEGGDSMRYSAVFGADGGGSNVRQAMEREPGFSVRQAPLEHGYKELSIPPAPGGGFRMERNALHIWPRRTFMLIALPNADGSFTCTLFLPMTGADSFEALRDPAAARAFFEREFPDAVPLLPRLEEEFIANPTGHLVTVRCGPWNAGGRALLIGDAAHAIVPFFGQGMNAGFEDCVILDAMLAGGAGWEEVIPAFARDRKPDADAIADMAEENFIEMRDRVADPGFLLEKEIEKVLETRFPGRFVSRYAMVSFSRVPYRRAQELGRIQAGILAELRQGIREAGEVDLKRAERLIAERLQLKERSWIWD